MSTIVVFKEMKNNRIYLEKPISNGNSKKFSIPVRPIDIDTLRLYRKKGVPSIIVKEGDKLFHTKIDKNWNVVSACHLCSRCLKGSAAKNCSNECIQMHDHQQKLERYGFIHFGYETFGGNNPDHLVVKNCMNNKS